MAAIFDFVLPGGNSDDIVIRLCGAAVESVLHRLVDHGRPSCGAARVIGGIVTAAGFPEIGIPIALAGPVIGRWLADPKKITRSRSIVPATGNQREPAAAAPLTAAAPLMLCRNAQS